MWTAKTNQCGCLCTWHKVHFLSLRSLYGTVRGTVRAFLVTQLPCESSYYELVHFPCFTALFIIILCPQSSFYVPFSLKKVVHLSLTSDYDKNADN